MIVLAWTHPEIPVVLGTLFAIGISVSLPRTVPRRIEFLERSLLVTHFAGNKLNIPYDSIRDIGPTIKSMHGKVSLVHMKNSSDLVDLLMQRISADQLTGEQLKAYVSFGRAFVYSLPAPIAALIAAFYFELPAHFAGLLAAVFWILTIYTVDLVLKAREREHSRLRQ